LSGEPDECLCLVVPQNARMQPGHVERRGSEQGVRQAQFSKYIRPGSHRVTATYQPQTSVNVQAFSGTNNVIVALNQNTSAKSQTFTISSGNFTNVHRYTTSNTKKLSDDGSVTVTKQFFHGFAGRPERDHIRGRRHDPVMSRNSSRKLWSGPRNRGKTCPGGPRGRRQDRGRCGPSGFSDPQESPFKMTMAPRLNHRVTVCVQPAEETD